MQLFFTMAPGATGVRRITARVRSSVHPAFREHYRDFNRRMKPTISGLKLRIGFPPVAPDHRVALPASGAAILGHLITTGQLGQSKRDRLSSFRLQGQSF